MTLTETIEAIRPADKEAARAAQTQWDSIVKPLGALGLLEDAVCRIAGAGGSHKVDIRERALAVFVADNGVVAEGISQSGSEVTAIVAKNLCLGVTSVCRMANVVNCRVVPVDVGMLSECDHPNMVCRKLIRGTGNIAKESAMTREQAIGAIESGIAQAVEFAQSGARLLAAGEMGIGNTTTTSAVASILLSLPPEQVTGRGAGLTAEGLKWKIKTVERAIEHNPPDPEDPIDILAKVGGLDIAAMCGFYLGAAVSGVPVILDGIISNVAALCAYRLCTDSVEYMLAGHLSTEPAAEMLLEALKLQTPLTGGMHLGEGAGAVALMPLLDMALAVYHGSSTFDEAKIEAYTRLV